MRQSTRVFAPRQTTSFATTAEALKAGGLDWNVELESIKTASGFDAPAKAVVRTDTRKPLGVVGTRYSPISNEMATRWLDRHAAYGVKVTGTEAYRGGERCVMYADVGERAAEVKVGDFVKLQLVVSWSHDGTSSTSAHLRALRLVCTNGLTMVAKEGRMFSVRHTTNGDVEADSVQTQVQAAMSRFDATVDVYRGLANRRAQRPQVREYVRQVMQFEPDEKGDLTTRSANILDAIVARFDDTASAARELVAAHQERETREAEAHASLLNSMVENFDGAGRGQTLNGGATWWNAYNAVTEHLTHDRGRNDETRSESLLFGTSARLNERALEVAMNMSGAA